MAEAVDLLSLAPTLPADEVLGHDDFIAKVKDATITRVYILANEVYGESEAGRVFRLDRSDPRPDLLSEIVNAAGRDRSILIDAPPAPTPDLLHADRACRAAFEAK